jgi:BioD-like phosphotransacetylase family protein
MTNDFANISAENNLNDMIVMSASEITEANAWFDERNESAVTSMDNDEIPMSF